MTPGGGGDGEGATAAPVAVPTLLMAMGRVSDGDDMVRCAANRGAADIARWGRDGTAITSPAPVVSSFRAA